MERDLAESLVRRFRAVAEPAMRRALVRETILLLDPPSVAGLLVHLVASRDDPAARAAWLDAVLVLLLDPALAPEKRAEARASLPGAGASLPDAGAPLPDAGARPPAAGVSQPAAVAPPSAARGTPPVCGTLLSGAGAPPPAAGVSQPAAGVPPLAAGASLSDAGAPVSAAVVSQPAAVAPPTAARVTHPVGGTLLPGAGAPLPAAGVWAFLDDPPASRPSGPPPPYDLDDVPLGVRKARARGRGRDDLRRIAADPDPSVVRILLENPVLTEADVLHAASLRPQVAPIFDEIVSSIRFGTREAVQAAMVLNPWCPARIALALLPLLPRTRLREVAAMTRLSAEVRAAAKWLAG